MLFANVKRVNTNIPIQVEAEAIHWAIILASRLNIHKVGVESDSANCIDAVKAPKQRIPWRLLIFVDEVQTLAVHFSLLDVSWVNRDSNKAARVLARWTLKNSVSVFLFLFFMNHPPPCV